MSGGFLRLFLSGVSTFRISPDDHYRSVKTITSRVETLVIKFALLEAVAPKRRLAALQRASERDDQFRRKY